MASDQSTIPDNATTRSARRPGPKLSVIIPSHDNLELLKRCVASWRPLLGLPTELVIIEDGCNDGTAEWLASIADGEAIRWFHEDDVFETLADNRGMKEARGEYILIWQDDMFVRDPEVILAGIDLLDAHRRLAVVGLMRGLMFRPLVYAPTSYAELYDSKHARIPVYGEPWRAAEVHACVRPWLLRRECIEKHGLFDPIYAPFNWDEADLHMRLRTHGWQIATLPGERMNGYLHQASSSTSKHKVDWFNGIVFRNGMIFYDRWSASFDGGDHRAPTGSFALPDPRRIRTALRHYLLVDTPRRLALKARNRGGRILRSLGILKK